MSAHILPPKRREILLVVGDNKAEQESLCIPAWEILFILLMVH